MNRKELTFSIVVYSIVAGVVLAAANVYLALLAGMTVSAAIPACMLGVALFRKRSLLEINNFQTGTSAGEALAAGAVFVIPAFVLTGVWKDFTSNYWEMALILALGGSLGTLLMILFRKPFVVEGGTETPYPEGVAGGQVLLGRETAGILGVMMGGGAIGAVFKLLQGVVLVIKEGVVWSWSTALGVFGCGLTMSPALLGIGCIVGIEVGAALVIGALITSAIGIPVWTVLNGITDAEAYMDAYKTVRLIGIGTMLVAGTYTIWKTRGKIVRGLIRARQGSGAATEDLPMKTMLAMDVATIIGIFILYWYMVGSFGVALMGLILIVPASFVFVAVSCYICGVVGSSNNPASGMIICVTLVCGILFGLAGIKGEQGIIGLLLIAAVIGTAACMAGDIAQNLKTGHMVGGSPKAQQTIQLIVGIVSAFAIPVILVLLHSTRGIGIDTTPNDDLGPYDAPQATMVAGLVKALMSGGKDVPWDKFIIGAIMGAVIIILDGFLSRQRAKAVALGVEVRRLKAASAATAFSEEAAERAVNWDLGPAWRLFPMVVAVGMYLPMGLNLSMLLGGIVGHIAKKKAGNTDAAVNRGINFATGLVAGEAIIGVAIAVPVVFGASLPISLIDSTLVSVVPFALVGWLIYHIITKRTT